MIRILALIAVLFSVAPALAQPLPANLDKANAIVIDTTKGRIIIKLRPDLAPNHAERIKQLARDGFYNNVPFHRVMDGFMAQTGDGQNFNGTGGSKYPNLKAEFSSVPFKRGVVGMARRGDSVDTANSQFFIMFADGSSLNGQYTVIGDVVSGMDVVDKLKKAPPGSAAVARFGKTLIRLSIALLCAAPVSAARAQMGQVDNIKQAGARLLACWKPPPASRANPEVEITVVVSFTRDGNILGRPKITYESENANDNDRLMYRIAVMETLQRCTPMPFTESMGGAVAGRPFAIRFPKRKPPPQPIEKRAWLTTTTL